MSVQRHPVQRVPANMFLCKKAREPLLACSYNEGLSLTEMRSQAHNFVGHDLYLVGSYVELLHTVV